MKRYDVQITAERLMESVDAIYLAWDSHASNGIALRHPLDILGAPDMPDVLAAFTKFEITEASNFLERMGVIVRV